MRLVYAKLWEASMQFMQKIGQFFYLFKQHRFCCMVPFVQWWDWCLCLMIILCQISSVCLAPFMSIWIWKGGERVCVCLKSLKWGCCFMWLNSESARSLDLHISIKFSQPYMIPPLRTIVLKVSYSIALSYAAFTTSGGVSHCHKMPCNDMWNPSQFCKRQQYLEPRCHGPRLH